MRRHKVAVLCALALLAAGTWSGLRWPHSVQASAAHASSMERGHAAFLGSLRAAGIADISQPARTKATPTPTATATQAATATPTASSSSGPDQYQSYLLNLINTSRAQLKLKAYAFSTMESSGSGSCVGSYGHSMRMQKEGYISHDQFAADICIPWTAAGENVGMGTGTEDTVIQELHNAMMAEGPSGGHYQNIMSTTFKTVGLGLYYVNGTLWLSEDFTN